MFNAPGKPSPPLWGRVRVRISQATGLALERVAPGAGHLGPRLLPRAPLDGALSGLVPVAARLKRSGCAPLLQVTPNKSLGR